jgi:Domain of unknown function (DUF4412)
MESGYHTNRWFSLDALFLHPRALAPLITALAGRLRPYGVSAVCGPLLGGAFVAQALATDLGVDFYFAEPVHAEPGSGLFRGGYRLPDGLKASVRGARVALADDMKQVMVFDGTKQVLDIIDTDKKTYTEMTKDDVEKLGGQVSDAMAQMQKQMANLPPEQRAQMEAMMKGRMGGAGAAAAPKIQYKKAGTDTVGKWTCDKYEGFENGQKTSEVCTVDPKVLGLAASDFEISRQLAEFFRKMMPGAGQMFTIGTVADQGFSGVPVRRTYTTGGREVTSEITEVSRQSFPDSSYAVPAVSGAGPENGRSVDLGRLLMFPIVLRGCGGRRQEREW